MSITMTTVILFAVFGVLLFLGVPISISIVASSIVTAMSTLSWDQITFITMQKMNSGVESFSLLAVPLFILAGNIMNNGGIAKRLVNFAQLFVGKIPGSMAQANILGNMLFGALSGSSVAAASAMGGCISPIEEENGYDPAYSAAANIASAPHRPADSPDVCLHCLLHRRGRCLHLHAVHGRLHSRHPDGSVLHGRCVHRRKKGRHESHRH